MGGMRELEWGVGGVVGEKTGAMGQGSIGWPTEGGR
jgi:hypothetical protein